MPQNPNFLIGYGERLAEPIPYPKKKFDGKESPYLFQAARDRLAPMADNTVSKLRTLSAELCPQDNAVAVIDLHPQFLAKSFYPSRLLMEMGVEALGSRPLQIKPEKWTKKKPVETSESISLFIGGKRKELERWSQELRSWNQEHRASDELTRVELLRPMLSSDRLFVHSDEKEVAIETVLHSDGSRRSGFVLEGYRAFLESLGIESNFDRRTHVGGLCFLPMMATSEQIEKLSQFSFLRVIRELPRLRPITTRSFSSAFSFKCDLPDAPAMDHKLKAAVFDGGLRPSKEFSKWVDHHDGDGVVNAMDSYLEHGESVTSAVLFGPLEDGVEAPIPFSSIDHYRVLDEETGIDDPTDPNGLFKLYDVLERIRKVLQSNNYSFINLSIGPEVTIEDNDVHLWTSALDTIFSTGDTLACIAPGNNGELDHQSGNARIQVPGDCVNALAVGAADNSNSQWQRAPYSSIGPGRHPGIVKPDILAFGGSSKEPFWVVNPSVSTQAVPTLGTSFSSPFALRMALGIRAHFGETLSPLAIRALLIHCSSPASSAGNLIEHGWGKIPNNVEDFVVCPDGTARIVFQGEMHPSELLRAQIPIPEEEIKAMVNIRATFCFACETDPHDPGNYTRSGLDVTFRPNSEKQDPRSISPKSESFFQLKDFSTEQELRDNAHKWETTLHKNKAKRGSSLKDPVFDIHYNSRESGARTNRSTKLRYALVITVTASNVPDLYNKIIRRYPTQLKPLVPMVQIPIRS